MRFLRSLICFRDLLVASIRPFCSSALVHYILAGVCGQQLMMSQREAHSDEAVLWFKRFAALQRSIDKAKS